MSNYQKSIGKDAAIAMSESKWWVGKSAREIAKTGMLIRELCLPFSELHKALETALGRPVYTHEFGLNFDGLIQELLGERDSPTMEEIIELIPEEKRILISTETQL